MVDWKWEYMETAFANLSPLVNTFLEKFDEKALKAPVGQNAEQADGIDPKCIAKIAAAKGSRLRFSALVEAYSTFARVCGREVRWFTGCKCHDHIWADNKKSDASKLHLLQRELGPQGPKVQTCIWRGRRGSELARGHWRGMLSRMQAATSKELHRRLTILEPDQRAAVLHSFQALRNKWTEEVGSKFSYWSELPHLVLGMYPEDAQGQEVAREVVAKAPAAGSEMHRLTYRWLLSETPNFSNMIRAYAETGHMAPQLKIELQEANMLSTVEQRIEEVHAKIEKHNKTAGRPAQPPALSARIRFPQHLLMLENDWRVLLFLIQACGKRKNIARVLLPFTSISKNVFSRGLNHGEAMDELIQYVYHFHPKQLFLQINAAKFAHTAFKDVVSPAPIPKPQTLKLFLDFLKDLWSVGTIFSLPLCAQPEREVLDVVPFGEVPPPIFSADTVVGQCLAAAHSPPPPDPVIGLAFKDHKFYRVVNSSLKRRFLQHCALDKDASIGVVELQLGGRNADGTAIFGETDGGIRHINLLRCAETAGVEQLLLGSVIWPEMVSATLKLMLPGAGKHAHGMLPLPALAEGRAAVAVSASKAGACSARWQATLSQILTFLGQEDEECSLDFSAGRMISLDSSRSEEVDGSVVQDLVSAGILHSGVNEFSELKLRINYDSVTWCSTSGVRIGHMALTSHVRLDRLWKHPKLALMMHLSADGWLALDDKEKDSHYEHGGAQLFVASHQRPKSYFAVLCVVDRVLQKLSIAEGTLPLVYHHMPDMYYRCLMSLSTAKQMLALTDILERTEDVRSLRDQEFKTLLSEEDGDSAVWDDGPDERDPTAFGVLALRDHPAGPGKANDADIRRVHQIAQQVLKGIPAAMVDIRSRWRSVDEDRLGVVHFDNCSHSSGKQRAYISCPLSHHKACFRYTTVELHESPGHAAAYLCSWANYARDKPVTFTKEKHKNHNPSDADVATLLSSMREDT